LVYLDNAHFATPIQVVDALTDYYYRYNANIHRGIHTMSEEGTKLTNQPAKNAQFIDAPEARE